MTYPDAPTYPGNTLFPDGPGASTFYFGPSTFWGVDALLGEAAEPLGAPFLVDQLGMSGRLIVEAAFGADLTADPGTWSWADLSHDVRHDDGIACSLGRGDEAATSQPAKLGLTLDNRAGRYARGPGSSYWPGVRRGTPVRVRVRTGVEIDPAVPTTHLLWQGYADAWSPAWDVTGRDATVELSASGTLRRLKQGRSPSTSVLRRSLPRSPSLLAYWPCEDGERATSITAGVEGVVPMAVAGDVAFAGADEKDFDASAKLPLIRSSTWVGLIPDAPVTGKVHLRFLLSAQDEGTYPAAVSDLVWLHLTGGSLARVGLRYWTSGEGSVQLVGYAPGGTSTVLATGTMSSLKERPQVMQVQLRQDDPATITWEVAYYFPGSDVYLRHDGTFSGQVGRPVRVSVGDPKSGCLGLTSIGHITVRGDYVTGIADAYSCYLGEYADDRIARLCAEAGIPVAVAGSSLQRMGAQSTDDVLALLRECEAVDGGILYDGAGPGLQYVCRTVRESPTPALTVDVAGGQAAKALDLTDDDQANRNEVTVKRRGGSEVTVTDEDGPAGVKAIGVYDDSATLAIHSDTRIIDHAGWAVHLGTTEGYRMPELQVWLERTPELAGQVLGVRPSSRVDLAGVNGRRTQLDEASLALLVEGWSAKLDQFRWRVKFNTSPAAPWRVGRLAAESGPPVDGELRAVTDGAYVYAKANQGATSLQVATSSGPVWTTDPDDYPMILDVGGRRVTATACSGEASPQTFAVAALPGRALAGQSVGLWQSPVLGL